jgi:hypothetical protein
VTPITVATGRAGAPIIVDASPDLNGNNPVAVSPDGATLYAEGTDVDAISTASNAVEATIPVPPGVQGLVFTPDGQTVYAEGTGDSEVTPISVATNTAGTPIRFAPIGTYVSGIAMSPDGKAFWVGVNGDGVIDVISTATSNGLGSTMVGTASYAIAFSQDGTTAYVAKSSGSVIPISTATYQAGTPIPAGGDPVAIAVTPAPAPNGRAPAFTSPATATAMFGSAFTFTVAASGTPAPWIGKTGTLPAGLRFTSGRGTATISGTPKGSASGVYRVALTARNRNGTASQLLTLTVNRAPGVETLVAIRGTEGAALTRDISVGGYPAPALAETGQLPAGLSFTDNGNGTASIAGTPAPGSHGRYAVGITASNAWGSVTTNLTIVITKGAH